jgi:hypothetical protein
MVKYFVGPVLLGGGLITWLCSIEVIIDKEYVKKLILFCRCSWLPTSPSPLFLLYKGKFLPATQREEG